MAKAKSSESRAADVIKNWVRSRTTLEFLGTWELLYNPDFKVVEFDHFRMQAGLPMFTLSVGEWIEKTNAVGLYVERGRPQPSKAKPCSAKVTPRELDSHQHGVSPPQLCLRESLYSNSRK
jgi:hypothetical protein